MGESRRFHILAWRLTSVQLALDLVTLNFTGWSIKTESYAWSILLVPHIHLDDWPQPGDVYYVPDLPVLYNCGGLMALVGNMKSTQNLVFSKMRLWVKLSGLMGIIFSSLSLSWCCGSLLKVKTCICRECINSSLCCADINECEKDNGKCTDHSTCMNTPGSYECVCDTGYKAHGSKCIGSLNTLLYRQNVQCRDIYGDIN